MEMSHSVTEKPNVGTRDSENSPHSAQNTGATLMGGRVSVAGTGPTGRGRDPAVLPREGGRHRIPQVLRPALPRNRRVWATSETYLPRTVLTGVPARPCVTRPIPARLLWARGSVAPELPCGLISPLGWPPLPDRRPPRPERPRLLSLCWDSASRGCRPGCPIRCHGLLPPAPLDGPFDLLSFFHCTNRLLTHRAIFLVCHCLPPQDPSPAGRPSLRPGPARVGHAVSG